MLNDDDLRAALEAAQDDPEIDFDATPAGDDDESNDSVDESLPNDETETESDDDDEPGEGDTEAEDGEGEGESPDEPVEGEGEPETGEGDDAEPEDDTETAKQKLLDATPMPETDDHTESVEIKDSDDHAATADNSPAELQLDMEAVGALEGFIDSLSTPALDRDHQTRFADIVTMSLRSQYGLESFGLEHDFTVRNHDDCQRLIAAMRDRVAKNTA